MPPNTTLGVGLIVTRPRTCGPSLALVSVLVSFGLAACGCRSAPVAAIDAEFVDWNFGRAAGTKIITEHYELHTTLKDQRLLATLPELMERTHEQYARLVPPHHDHEQRMPVYLFARRPEWEYFTRRFTGGRAGVFLQIRNGGYSEQGVTVVQYVSHPATFPLLAHEGLHQYLHHRVTPQAPAWLNEGLATVCEGQRWTGDRLAQFDPHFNPTRANALAEALLEKRLLPLRQLLGTHAGRIVGETGRTVATYYAQVWGLVLFLMEAEGGKYAAAFERLCAELASPKVEASPELAGNPGEAIFRSYITDDLDGFERELNRYWGRRLLNTRDEPGAAKRAADGD